MSNVERANQLYNEGKYLESLKLYQLEAEKGSPECKTRLGFMYYQGKGVSRDLETAETWFRQALAEENDQASVGLFRVLIEQELYQEALIFIRKMARRKYPPALYWLGRMYYNGFGLAKDFKKALIYFTLAGQYGHFAGMRARSKLLMKGQAGFLSRYIGLYEFICAFFTITRALHKNPNDQNQFY